MSNEMQPTLVFEPGQPTPVDAHSVAGSAPCVGFVAGKRDGFSTETATLLRSRLVAALSVMIVVLTLAFVTSVTVGATTLWGLRLVVIGLFVGALWLLRTQRMFSSGQLRVFELSVFGLVLIQLCLVQWARFAGAIADQDPVMLTAVRYQYLGAWCLVILIYGIFVPNSWQRGAIVMFVAACTPYLLLWLQMAVTPALQPLLAADRLASPLPLPLAAALVGTYGAHIIHSSRRNEFKARQFGQYRLLNQLGSGGMGVVYKAEHLLLKRACAIKLIRSECEADARAVERFEREVRVMAQLTHWNTVEIYDYGRTDDGTFYYVMELLPGLSLDEILRQHGPLEPERVVHLLQQVCAALDEAHRIGLIHRDLKPANIFASQRGGIYDVAKLLDFGLVKEQHRPTDEANASERGGISGTPSYMAPEQALNNDQVDPRGDLYSLGAVAYHLLTGQPPFLRDTVLATLAAHAHATVAAPSQINPRVGPDLDQVILKCLEKQAERRYQTAAELGSALRQCSCSALWTDDRAQRWWEDRRGTAPQRETEALAAR
ncbi:MAG: serine/threonine protein kinase [Planctomycetaceae bacterium]|nr:serine/threonine protein kinase [Planctomycetaceae bacterium]